MVTTQIMRSIAYSGVCVDGLVQVGCLVYVPSRLGCLIRCCEMMISSNMDQIWQPSAVICKWT